MTHSFLGPPPDLHNLRLGRFSSSCLLHWLVWLQLSLLFSRPSSSSRFGVIRHWQDLTFVLLLFIMFLDCLLLSTLPYSFVSMIQHLQDKGSSPLMILFILTVFLFQPFCFALPFHEMTDYFWLYSCLSCSPLSHTMITVLEF